MPNIGEMNKLIEIQAKTTESNGRGGVKESWSKFADAWAKIQPITGREFFQAKATQGEVTGKITIYYIPGIKADMRVLYEGRVFELVAPPINEDEANINLTLMVKELVSDG